MPKSGLVLVPLLLAFGFARVANADSFVTLRMGDQDRRLYAGPYNTWFRYNGPPTISSTDWAYGEPKAECGTFGFNALTTVAVTTVAGVSNISGAWSCGPLGLFGCFRVAYEGLLCNTAPVGLQVTQFFDTWLSVGGSKGSDQRDTATGDWAFGFWKAECGPTQVLTGLSHSKAICSATNMRAASNCNVRWANGGNSQPASNRGDWDPGLFKAECGLREYVKGVASADDQWKAVLCCTPQF